MASDEELVALAKLAGIQQCGFLLVNAEGKHWVNNEFGWSSSSQVDLKPYPLTNSVHLAIRASLLAWKLRGCP